MVRVRPLYQPIFLTDALSAISDFTSAGFAALAALLGAYVGGRNLVRLGERRQSDRDIRERREEARLVKSVARVHSDNLRRASTVASTVLVSNRWPHRGEHRLAREGRLLLARHLTMASWQTFSEAHCRWMSLYLQSTLKREAPAGERTRTT
jgi:hypothetical protein